MKIGIRNSWSLGFNYDTLELDSEGVSSLTSSWPSSSNVMTDFGVELVLPISDCILLMRGPNCSNALFIISFKPPGLDGF